MKGAQVESYVTFTQRLLAQQRVQYASLTFAQEQRRLRIHLRRILLLHNDPHAIETNKVHTTQHFDLFDSEHWRQEAIAREQERAHRHVSARIIQRNVLKWLTRRSDVELPSASEWVSLPPTRSDPSRLPPPRRGITTYESELSPTLTTLTQPFQVIVELLGARDLSLGNYEAPEGIDVDVRLLHRATNDELGRLKATTTAVPNEDIVWDDQVLQLGIDSPETALAQGAVHVDLFAQGPKRVSLGCLVVALDLLETPLADKYAMTRWFPLERGRGSNVARHVKGEVRLGIRLLMRNPRQNRNSDDVWVPYVGVQQSPPPNTTKRSTKPPLSPRKRGSETALSPSKSNRPSSQRHYTRAEIMSPPSSPSSYSSDSNMDFSPTKAPASPSLRAQSPSRRRSSGGITSSASQRRSLTSRRGITEGGTNGASQSPQREVEDPDAEPPRPMFLKRKPYKVVFQKLDWSRVSAKTDSNWGVTGKPGTTKLGGSLLPASRPAIPKDHATRDTPASQATINFSGRLASVTQQMYEACRVTKETAPLAQMRYRTERKRWLQNLQSLNTNRTTSSRPTELSEETLHKLWMELQSDVDGAKYTASLHADTLSTCT